MNTGRILLVFAVISSLLVTQVNANSCSPDSSVAVGAEKLSTGHISEEEILVSQKDGFKAALPNGTSVELIATGDFKSIGKLLQGPDGKELNGPVYVRSESMKEGTAFVLTVENDKKIEEERLRWVDNKGSRLSVIDMRNPEFKQYRSYRGQKLFLKENKKKVDIKIYLECDQWQTEVSYDGRYMTSPANPSRKVTFSESYVTAEGVKLAFEHNIEGKAVRIIADAVMTRNNNGVAEKYDSTIIGYIQDILDNDGNKKQLAVFRGINLKQVKNFKLQSRPYYVITFADIPVTHTRHPITSCSNIEKYDLTNPSDYLRQYFETQKVGDYNFVEYEIIDEYVKDGKTGSLGAVAALTTLQGPDGRMFITDKLFYLYRWHTNQWEGVYKERQPNKIPSNHAYRFPSDRVFKRYKTDEYLKRIEEGFVGYDSNISRPAPARDSNNKTLPPNTGEKWDTAFADAIGAIKNRVEWHKDNIELVKTFWQARAEKNYDEMKILWPGSGSWNWEEICKNDANVEYVFGREKRKRKRIGRNNYDIVIIRYAKKKEFEKTGEYNLKMYLRKANRERYYIVSAN